MSLRRRFAGATLVLCLLAAPLLHAYPIAEERELGERFALETAGVLPLVRDPSVVEYVNAIGRKIVSRLDGLQPFDYRFHVVRDPQLNAFAVPGGFVYVNSGLLTRVANDSELAGVLGHEIAHSHAHHIVRQQEKSRLVSYAALAAILLSVIHPAIGAAAMGTNATVQLAYAREFEQEADYLGFRYVKSAGYDPHGMASFMKKIWDEQRTSPDEVPPYMLSHPLTAERITNLETAARGVPRIPGSEMPSFALERAQAIVRAESGDRAAVRDRYEKAASSSARSTALFGIVLLEQGDAAGARRELDRAKQAGVADLDVDLAKAAIRGGDLDGAVRILKGRTEVAADDAVALSLLGRAFVQKGDYAAARDPLERAIAIAPELDDVEYDLAQSYGKSGDAANGLLHLARAAELRGELERAAAHYEKAAKLLPKGSAEAEEADAHAAKLREIQGRRMIGR